MRAGRAEGGVVLGVSQTLWETVKVHRLDLSEIPLNCALAYFIVNIDYSVDISIGLWKNRAGQKGQK